MTFGILNTPSNMGKQNLSQTLLFGMALRRLGAAEAVVRSACTHKIAIGERPDHVRFGPLCGLKSGISPGPQCANRRHMHRRKQHHYSITSSARASNVGGIVIPSALA